MLVYLLDTNICIYVIRKRPSATALRFDEHDGRMAISAVTAAELFYGAEKSSRPADNMHVARSFLERLEVLDFTLSDAEHYGSIRHELVSRGQPMALMIW